MDGWGWLEPRAAEELLARQFGRFGGDRDDDDDGGNRNGTAGRSWDRDGDGDNDGRGRFGGGWGNNFRFQAARSIRTSTIILSVFNVVAAFATAVGILWDAYATAKRNNPKFSFRYDANVPWVAPFAMKSRAGIDVGGRVKTTDGTVSP